MNPVRLEDLIRYHDHFSRIAIRTKEVNEIISILEQHILLVCKSLKTPPEA